jgi:hypothetical protein
LELTNISSPFQQSGRPGNDQRPAIVVQGDVGSQRLDGQGDEGNSTGKGLVSFLPLLPSQSNQYFLLCSLISAEQMSSLIGFPDFLFNDTLLDQYYENFTLQPGDHHALQVEKASVWAQKKAFRRLIEPVDRDEFGTSSAVVNAFYSGVKNAISQWP